MAIAVRGSTWDPFTSLVRQLDSDFDTIVRRAFGGAQRSSAGFVPAANVVKDGTDVVVTLELPGIDAENLDVEVADGRLRISGRREEESRGEDGGVLIREIRAGEFRREFALPEHVTGDSVEAEYTDGLLRVRVRDVTKPAPKPRKIEVRTTPKALDA
ncbi:Hsp20/alpha crystallin family protein [Amycolatopsis anabasis]|uniref:Hsp20/alpha crystallin family protein n=1 Tax=Amycolatopsis anabasis TaxID=1840409 RepID=UPI00131BD919|nr:Hsp20/alpha crystallin family protein [Amycolatopsis anabasis]